MPWQLQALSGDLTGVEGQKNGKLAKFACVRACVHVHRCIYRVYLLAPPIIVGE